MRIVEVFLASSISEFWKERKEISNEIRKMNNSFIRENSYVKLITNDRMSNHVAAAGKQEEYNERIRHCDVFIAILGKCVGKYTEEEIMMALYENEKKERPHIYILKNKKILQMDDPGRLKTDRCKRIFMIEYQNVADTVKEILSHEL